MTLRVNGPGHMLHAYVNGHYVSSQWAKYGVFNYVFENNAKLQPEKNQITLLSATIGLQNYGLKFDLIESGIIGPVEVVSRKRE